MVLVSNPVSLFTLFDIISIIILWLVISNKWLVFILLDYLLVLLIVSETIIKYFINGIFFLSP